MAGGESRGYFIAGTDTGVGKTRVSCALLRAFGARGRTTVGMKPVVAGREDGSYRDVELLQAASSVAVSRRQANPYAFAPAIAPHIAAERAGVVIHMDVIRAAAALLQGMAERVVVEGAGGFLVPLGPDRDGADMAVALGFPVILVVGMRLGCLNHALLTARAVRDTGLPFAGWVANCIEPELAMLDENIGTLAQRLDGPLLGILPFGPAIDAVQLSLLLDIDRLEQTSIRQVPG
ncbi:dethiobiotin synthase [Nitrosovibrio sp. Nv17]|jgi:dethiobiotin synthetase|uniref:dethiobiotin synthase n=1 Tax=Nitrosovibrio sp. Nv17 TaxID=1855339 RepID=UPI000908CF32|nr:dethiobiotin synthase [Nitrosovibrio sp. Nv17]SFW35191.1 dethiobiotin synthetase [Nitrosovibrio sp. Nv17]